MKVKHALEQLNHMKPDDHIAMCVWTEKDVKELANSMKCFVLENELTEAEIYDVTDELEEHLNEPDVVNDIITNIVNARR